MPAAVLPGVARAVGALLLVVGEPEALRGQDPVVREVPETAAAAVAMEEGGVTLELLPGEAVLLVAVPVVVVLVVVAPANQPKPLFPAQAAFPRSSLYLLPPLFPFLLP